MLKLCSHSNSRNRNECHEVILAVRKHLIWQVCNCVQLRFPFCRGSIKRSLLQMVARSHHTLTVQIVTLPREHKLLYRCDFIFALSVFFDRVSALRELPIGCTICNGIATHILPFCTYPKVYSLNERSFGYTKFTAE